MQYVMLGLSVAALAVMGVIIRLLDRIAHSIDKLDAYVHEMLDYQKTEALNNALQNMMRAFTGNFPALVPPAAPQEEAPADISELVELARRLTRA